MHALDASNMADNADYVSICEGVKWLTLGRAFSQSLQQFAMFYLYLKN